VVPPVRPVRFNVTGEDEAPEASGDCDPAVVVVPDDKVDDVPQVNVTVLEAPFDVPVPFNVAVCSVTFVAGSVAAVGGTTLAGVTNDKMPPKVVF
jgi:hypothetical protein